MHNFVMFSCFIKVLINPKWVFVIQIELKKLVSYNLVFFVARLVVEIIAVKRASLATFGKKVRIQILRLEAWVPGTNFHRTSFLWKNA